MLTLDQIRPLIESANLSSLARNAEVSYHALRRMVVDPDYDPPYSLIAGLSRYYAEMAVKPNV